MCYVAASKNEIKETAKLLQKKYRDERGLFLAEGFKLLEEILEKDVEIVEVFTLEKFENKNIKAPIYIVNEAEMKKISSTESVCEVLTVAKKKDIKISEFKKLNKIVLIDEVSDAGNLGTIIRSAAAFGVEGIILFGNCVDLYSPKVIRSTAGNFFKIPIIQIKSVKEFIQHFNGYTKVATALSAGNNISLQECKEVNKRIIMFGSEARGLNKELLNCADKNIRLEMKNGVESLNLGVCASIIMYELSKK